jgi:preprotein translocase subunit SecG
VNTFIITIHVVVSIFLILVILLQAGKGGGMGGAFGGAGSQTVFGGRGATTFLGKLTAGAAIVFMLTSVALSHVASRSSSVVGRDAAPVQGPAGTVPAQGTAPAPSPVPVPAAPAPGSPSHGATPAK